MRNRLKEAKLLLEQSRLKSDIAGLNGGRLSICAKDRKPSWREPGSVVEALIQLEQHEPSQFGFVATYSSLLRRCGKARALSDGKLVHAHIARSGYEGNVVLAELLVQMYGKCKRLEDARVVFDKMPQRSVFSWNVMLAAYAEHGYARLVLELYHRMDLEPDQCTFATVLGACSSLGALAEGKAIHGRMIANEAMLPDAISQNSLITMYAKCGRVEDAKSVFDGIAVKDVVSWNSMIAAYAQHGHSREALDLYYKMDSAGVKRNAITFSTTLGACSSLGPEALQAGKDIHAQIVDLHIPSMAPSELQSNVFVDTALLSMYANCCSLANAKSIFERMQQRNVVSWTAMIAGYAQHGHSREALDLFVRMNLEGVQPNTYTFSCVLAACANLGDLGMGKGIHARSSGSGFGSDVGLQNALVNMYAKCGRLDDAKRLFDSIPSKNDVSWNAMIAAYVQHGYNKEAFELYHSLDSGGVQPNDFIFASILGACSTLEEARMIHARIAASEYQSDDIVHNALMKMYAKCGSLELARKAFDEMPRRDDVSWNAMITAYVQQGHGNEALDLYRRMESQGVQPNAITFSSILTACLTVGSLEIGTRIHEDISSYALETDVVVGTALMNMYAKFGKLETAQEIFDKIQQRNVVSWNAMVAAYAQNGQSSEAIEVYRSLYLEGVQPDSISFICIFYAFSHAGLLDEGRVCFVSMGSDYGVEPTLDHYICMVDLLGRSGRIKEAEELILEMPFEPDVLSWMTLLGGCKLHGNTERGEYAAKRVFELDPEDSAPYVLLSNIYAAAGKQRDAESLKRAMVSLKPKIQQDAGYCNA